MSTREHVYTCDCERFCGGELKPVKRTVFYTHKQYRTADSRASAVTVQDGHTTNKRTRKAKANGGNPRKQGHHVGATSSALPATGVPAANSSSTGEPENTGGPSDPHAPPPAEQQQSEGWGTSRHPSIDPGSPPATRAPAQLPMSDEGTPGSYNRGDNPGFDDSASRASSPGFNIPEMSSVNSEDLGLPDTATLADLQTSLNFIQELQEASIDNDHIDEGLRERLRNAPQRLPDLDPETRLALALFLTNKTETPYTSIQDAFHRYLTETHLGSAADAPDKPMSYHQVKRCAEELSGVSAIHEDMCVNTCLAFTGPFKDLDKCPECGEDRFELRHASTNSRTRTRVARRSFLTMPVGPQIQALYRTEEGAQAMRYRRDATAKLLSQLNGVSDDGTPSRSLPSAFDDYIHGSEYLEAIDRGDIKDTDTVLLMSLDGAQLYQNKVSDCWIYLWVVLDHSPDVRYKKKHVLVGGVIPGPNKPKNVDSFLFPGLHHLSALMREGLSIWDASTNTTYLSNPFLAFVTADGPGMTYLNGEVGHQGACGCRLYCTQRGRLKVNGTTYYPASKKPFDYETPGSNFPDVNLRARPRPDEHPQEAASKRYWCNLKYVLKSENQTQYKNRRRETGIAKPSIFAGLPRNRIFRMPGCFPADIMHLVALNIPELLLKLWRGTLDCEDGDDKSSWDWVCLTGDTWKIHGHAVESTRRFLPGFFDRPPRDPAKKISSGYKAVEYLTYLFGLGPGLLYDILPDQFWTNYCKLVRGIRLLYQRHITIAEVQAAFRLLVEFIEEFEDLYYGRKKERLHFIRQSIHALLHMAPETIRLGPYLIFAQWVMERLIGELGRDLKQPSNPWGNIAACAYRRAQTSALLAMYPDLLKASSKDSGSQDSGSKDPETKLPRGAVKLDSGFTLLRAAEDRPRRVSPDEVSAMRTFWSQHVRDAELDAQWLERPLIKKWGRILLPGGLIARSVWKEERLRIIRMARNIKIRLPSSNCVGFAEVQYYFQKRDSAYAMIKMYGPRDEALFQRSYETIWLCQRQQELAVIDVKSILSVVAMVPWLQADGQLGSYDGPVFVVEKIGLDALPLNGVLETFFDDVDDGGNDAGGNEESDEESDGDAGQP
ncbi:hypothetical protein PsYK624_083390 [Phanerochaete sordida]|uniref:Uncharacterized protein n=1 Tax=Phanerochaete sordida TaxID=48140 RepID=A0A9P3LE62_9APHY|nr:hypothetical protein PsYK624_083390 [Phanerochaete sordida]